jgi:hypothetical protein
VRSYALDRRDHEIQVALEHEAVQQSQEAGQKLGLLQGGAVQRGGGLAVGLDLYGCRSS